MRNSEYVTLQFDSNVQIAVRHIMTRLGVNYKKTFEDQHPPVIANVVTQVIVPRIVYVQIQKEYPQFEDRDRTRLLSHLVVHCHRRTQFRRQRKEEPDTTRKRGRPVKANSLLKRRVF